jgi:hypothetical protein
MDRYSSITGLCGPALNCVRDEVPGPCGKTRLRTSPWYEFYVEATERNLSLDKISGPCRIQAQVVQAKTCRFAHVSFSMNQNKSTRSTLPSTTVLQSYVKIRTPTITQHCRTQANRTTNNLKQAWSTNAKSCKWHADANFWHATSKCQYGNN